MEKVMLECLETRLGVNGLLSPHHKLLQQVSNLTWGTHRKIFPHHIPPQSQFRIPLLTYSMKHSMKNGMDAGI